MSSSPAGNDSTPLSPHDHSQGTPRRTVGQMSRWFNTCFCH